MKLTVTTLSGELYMLDVGAEMELEGLKALCEFESGVPAREMVLMHEGRPLLDEKRSLTVALHQGGRCAAHSAPALVRRPLVASRVLYVRVLFTGDGPPLTLDFSRIPVPATAGQSSETDMSLGPRGAEEEEPAFIRDMILKSPDQLALLKHNNPQLADALLSGDLELFTRVLREQQKEKSDRDRQRIRMMNADPFDPETQRLIAEEIRQQNIDSNMEAAMEYHPESFGQVCLIDLKRNVLVMGTTGTETPFLGEGELPECARLQMLTASQSGSTLGSEASPRAGGSEEFPAATVDQLIALGFQRDKVVAALRQASGNSDQALAALLAQSLQGP
ncbi:hypothetical protein HPB49_013696 [Dermacentor silvarum]|uniref:Uncharacterized protein n=1 Tax=Dermacentor silvarum TaxID=543639 RepID=A0ACB8D5W1_DERSI|nr:hypothetical protein HPB49_013696 [Dermacentor silvarum]